jgi:hypothetical protein
LIKEENGYTLAAYNPASVGRAFISRDRGTTWKPVNKSAFVSRIISLALGKDGLVAAATSNQGVMLSEDYGQTWTPLPFAADKVYLAEQGSKYIVFASKNDLAYRLEELRKDTNAGVTPAQKVNASKAEPDGYHKASFALNQPYYMTDDNQVKMDAASYINRDGRFMVPLRYLAYALGISDQYIQWDERAQRVTLTNGPVTVGVTIADRILNINGNCILMDAAPETVSNRIFLPARPLAEALGWKVTWEPVYKSISLEK